LEFLSEFGLFIAKTVTLVIAVLVIITAIVNAARRQGDSEDESDLRVTRLNERYRKTREAMERGMMSSEDRKSWLKESKKKLKAEAKAKKKEKSSESSEKERAKVFVLDFDGDIKASETDTLRKAITAVIAVARPEKDEVMIRLESGGGLVHSYGLAAAQLDRIRSRNISLTVCVDKVAASGGYMMACVGDRILASPFAILGSIGVVAQLPNVHKLLKKNDIDFEVLTAGEHKRTLTVFGENTEKGRIKFLEDLEDTHQLFKAYVKERREAVDIESVATGDIWFGQQALEVNLIDEISTSDDYLLKACERAEVVHVNVRQKQSLPEKLGLAASTALERSFFKIASVFRDGRFQ